MKRFSALFERIERTTSINEKVSALADYFANENSRSALWAVYLFAGKGRKRLITSRILREYFIKVSKLPEWIITECCASVGDTAETITLLLNTADLGEAPEIEDLPLYRWLEKEIPSLGVMDDLERQEQIVRWWAGLGRNEVFILNKILTGGFRVGVSEKLLVRSLSQAFGVRETVLTHRLMGKWEPTAAFFEMLVSKDEADMPVGQPYPFFLASPLEDEEAIREDLGRWQVEWKWDGIRAQMIKRDDSLFIWSRGEDLITDQFSELVEDLMKLPDGTVIDGEIIAWKKGSPLSFHHLQKRLGRKRVDTRVLQETPVHLIAYDLLEYGGVDMRNRSLRERQSLLKKLLTQRSLIHVHLSEPVHFSSWEELKTLRERSREHGVEGLMFKDLSSAYGVGRKRGVWWKYKVDPLTLDAVLIYAQPGSGKRANLFTDYTFALWKGEELVPFAKAYSGLSNEEIVELDQWIRRNTVQRFGPVRAVRPVHVFEIGFEGISSSNRHKSGVAVRFPRILRWRRDKRVGEADSVESALTLV